MAPGGVRGFTKALAWRLASIATWVPIFIVIKSHLVDGVFVNGHSMSPFLNSKPDQTTSRDLCLNLKYNPQQHLKRGMIVTFLKPQDSSKQAMKRVVALEGDIVRTKHPFPHDTVVVPVGHVWVEGDAGPEKSLDSNHYGPISTQLITGRLTHILLPPEKMGHIRWWEHDRPGVFYTGRR